MTSDTLRRAVLTRRAFATAVAATGATALARPNGADESQDLAAAERLLGLEFNAEERQQARRRLGRQRNHYRALRRHDVDRDVAPAVRFDPRPAGTSWPPAGAGAVWQPLDRLPAITTEEDLAFATVDELAALLRAGKTTARDLTELSLRRLQQFDGKLHCVITLLAEHARGLADQADAEIQRGEWRGPLHGIPFGAKDLLAHPGAPTTFGAKPFEQQVIDREATVLRRLREAGAVLVGKLSLGALAMGDVWFGGRTRNPWNPEQGSSGSSAGPAAAVAAGLVPFAIGSETLGSIVSPCSRCGATGLRPTFGTVSRFGAMPLSWTMDKLGPIARSATDCALVFDAIRGPDGRDADAIAAPFDWRRGRPVAELRIGYVESRSWERSGAAEFVAVLERAGASPRPVALPDFPLAALLLVLNAEAAAAFDDLTRRGGLRELVSQGDGAWPNLLRAARTTPAVEYLRAMRIRSQLVDATAEALESIDALVALPFGDRSLRITNLTGHPCCVMPLGFRDDGTPTSITVIGNLYGDADAIAVAEHWQTQTDWHRRRPPLS